MPKPGTVWLVGMMGAGKSTVGPELAARLGLPFVDTDAEIEKAAGASIAEIFAREGEEAFRERERRAIDAAARCAAVVALGGGAVAQPGAIDRLGGCGILVYLKASPEALLARLGSGGDRPLLAGLSPAERRRRLTDLLEARRGAYEASTLVVDAERLDTASIVDEIAGRLAEAVSA